jgi:molybdopterin molybdotransferase
VNSRALVGVDEYLNRVLESLTVGEKSRLSLDDCLGSALADTVISTIPLPPFANSSMDGYALRTADVQQVPVELAVSADIPAGSASPSLLTPRTAARIMTGAPLPAGADAVIPVEWTDAGTHRVVINQQVSLGAHVRDRGDDLPEGSVLAEAGDEVDAARIGLMASSGIAECQVYRRPRVAIFATGDELVEPGVPLNSGHIYDSNTHLMRALVSADARVGVVGTLPDDPTVAATRLVEVARQSELLITMGGISAGAYEPIKQAFTARGGVDFCSVAMQPGKPQGCGFLGSTPLLALPGNPLSSLVSFEVFVRPALRVLGGFAEIHRPEAHLQRLTAQPRRSDRVRFLPAVADLSAGTVVTADRHGSHRSSTAAGANCLIELPMGSQDAGAGELVTVRLLS